jgi:type IV secretory pathway VirB10-like protein
VATWIIFIRRGLRVNAACYCRSVPDLHSTIRAIISFAKSTTAIARTPAIAMGDENSSSSKEPRTSSKETEERPELPEQSASDPAITSATTQSFSANYTPFSSATEKSSSDKRASTHSLSPYTTRDYDGDDDEYDEDQQAKLTKRFSSSSSHTNLHTECGRHSDDWIFKPLAKAVRGAFGDKKDSSK